jgi:NADP-dependent aldehyde dehydrogenase
MKITGEMLIGQSTAFGSAGRVRAFNPTSSEDMEPAFGVATLTEVDRACELAKEGFQSYRNTSPEIRGRFLETIADYLLVLGEPLYERAALETGLTTARIKGETQRTAAQMKMFADVVRHGRWRHAAIDSGDPSRQPLPRADLRMQKVPLGPVGVFGSSNFPILYSVAGGDTASALAAGCSVVVKAHGSHPGTSELVGRAIQKAVKDCGLHEGVFSLLFGNGNEVGEALVDHPAIQAVGFTGSEVGGMALVRRGAQRKIPIPVFAEMTSVNPNFVLPGAMKVRAKEFASQFVERMTAGAGQMCLKPGLILAVDDEHFGTLRDALGAALSTKEPETMLSTGIYKSFNGATARSRSGKGSIVVAKGHAPKGPFEGQSEIFEIDATEVITAPELANEMFGPAAALIRCAHNEQLLEVAKTLRGQLTMAVHMEPCDTELALQLMPILESKTNRILANKFSNMVEIGYATVHGGPYPATSDSRFTSVGATAIERFLRPVCYENLPSELLPPALQDGNPLSLWRVIDGELKRQ